jgi:protein-L-isoaspartate(D-aspartate) O-methyltransferase
MHALCLEELKDCLREGSVALDVGCGSGYLTSCMAQMVGNSGKVYGIDHIRDLILLSEANTRKGNPNLLEAGIVKYIVGDGRLGLAEFSPYDAIHVGAATKEIPQQLLDQLKVGGKMIVPVGDAFGQELLLVEKKEDGKLCKKTVTGVIYIPLTSEDNQLKRVF